MIGAFRARQAGRHRWRVHAAGRGNSRMDGPSSMPCAPRRAWRSLCLTSGPWRYGDSYMGDTHGRTTRNSALRSLDHTPRCVSLPADSPATKFKYCRTSTPTSEPYNIRSSRGCTVDQLEGLHADRVRKSATDLFTRMWLGIAGRFFNGKTDRAKATARSVRKTDLLD